MFDHFWQSTMSHHLHDSTRIGHMFFPAVLSRGEVQSYGITWTTSPLLQLRVPILPTGKIRYVGLISLVIRL